MIRLLVVFNFYFITLSVGQEWQCVRSYADSGAALPASISGFDKSANVYLSTGWHHYSSHGGGGTRFYCLKKFTSDCQPLWSVPITGLGNFRSVTDADGSTYVTGFEKIRKYNSSGQMVWEIDAQQQKGFGTVLLHPQGGIVVNGVEKVANTLRPFISRYTFNGILTSTIYDHIPGLMAVDGLGNYLLVREGETDAATGNWGHLYKYSKDGALLYHLIVPHTPMRILADIAGNIYLTGWHSIYPIEINHIKYTEPGSYLIKYNSDGQLLWHKHITPFGWAGTGPFAAESDGGLIYVTNYGKMKFDDMDFISEGMDLFVSGITPEGSSLWYKTTKVDISIQPGGLTPTDILRGPSGDIYITGMINGSHYFNPYMINTGKSSDYDDLFLAKLRVSETVGAEETQKTRGDISIFPNPSGHAFTLSAFLPEQQLVSCKILDVQGKCLRNSPAEKVQGSYGKEFDLSGYSQGIYFLEVWIGSERHTRKLVRN
jgi:hypothetical protein